MNRVLYITNYAAPYKVEFFDELGKHLDLTVLFSGAEEEKTRATDWFIASSGGFKAVFLEKKCGSLGGEDFCLDVIPWLKKNFDKIVIGGYSSPTAMLAMVYLRLKRKPFYIEVDGGLIRESGGPKYCLKKMLISSATWWISSGKNPTEYLIHYGARRDSVFEYPFSSLWERDILQVLPDDEEKQHIRQKLEITERKIVLAVGQFIHRKGFDVLMYAAESLNDDVGIYIVGGEPTEEYLQLQEILDLKHVHFVGFRKKVQLLEYYKAADLFVLPTREDIWGLVINEAMACGLPVITTDKCVAGLELVKDGINGYLVPVNNEQALLEKMKEVFSADYRKMGEAALETIRPYTMENMVKAHLEILN